VSGRTMIPTPRHPVTTSAASTHPVTRVHPDTSRWERRRPLAAHSLAADGPTRCPARTAIAAPDAATTDSTTCTSSPASATSGSGWSNDPGRCLRHFYDVILARRRGNGGRALRGGALIRNCDGGCGGALRDRALFAVCLGKDRGSLDTCRAASGHRLGRSRSSCRGPWAGADLCAVRDQDHLVVSPRCLHQVTRWDRGCQRADSELGNPADHRAAGRPRRYGDRSIVALSMVNHCRPST
jgi:hypothetical protein